MRIFMTGASGYVGSSVAAKALKRGHSVVGLAGSEASSVKLQQLGVTPLRGDLEDHGTLARGASEADAALHLGFVHEFNRPYDELVRIDQRAIRAVGNGLAGTGKPFITTSTTTVTEPSPDGLETTESSPLSADSMPRMRTASEDTTLGLVDEGVRASVLRLPPYVYGSGGSVFVPALLHSAATHGVSPYIGSGSTLTSAVYVQDLAELYLLAAEDAEQGSISNATTETGVSIKQLAEAIGRAVGVPARSVTRHEATRVCGPFIAMFLEIPNRASSEKARRTLGWTPQAQNRLLEDITAGPGTCGKPPNTSAN
ncbi:MAG: NAD(P)-binding protein [Edaphobacter sp.]|nr:NAD(P)-binding protein [Edaphobacter sp.]